MGQPSQLHSLVLAPQVTGPCCQGLGWWAAGIWSLALPTLAGVPSVAGARQGVLRALQPLWGGPLPPWGLRASCLWVGFSFFHKLSGRVTGWLAHTAHRPILLSSFNSGKTVLFRLHIKRSLNEMKSSSFNKQHKYLILF